VTDSASAGWDISDDVVIDHAREADVEAIVAVLSEDEVGGHDEYWSEARAPRYRAAFAGIEADPNAELLVARLGGKVVGMAQIGFVDLLSDQGTRRCLLNSLFVGRAARGRRIGARLLAMVEARARARGAGIVSLTSNKRRLDAHRFYRTNGFAQTSEGFKKPL